MQFNARKAMRGVALVATLALSVRAVAADLEHPPAVTRQKLALPGRTLAYVAEAGRLPIRDVATG